MGKAKLYVSHTKVDEQDYFKGSWLQLMRPMTWTGTISPIVAATGLAAMLGTIDFTAMLLLLVAALLIQVSANMLNDYFDFKNGQDQERWSTEPSTSLKTWNQPEFHQIPWVAFITFSMAVFLGIRIASEFGWWIGVVGIIGIIAACMYSAGNYSLAALGLGEVIGATFLGFVPFMLALVMQNAPIAGDMLLPGLPFVLLIASMILTNNIRDIQKDDGFRKTVPMRIGKRIAVGILYSLVIGAYLTIFILAWTKLVFWPVAMVVFALPMAIRLLRSVRKGASEEERQLGMKWSALHHWIFGLSYGAGIWIGLFL